MKLKILAISLAVTMGTMFTACGDWTEIEAIDTVAPSIDEDNPALYQEYLENLRNYKKTLHPLMIGWFDNSKKDFSSMGNHIGQVPDKVDILSLMSPDNLSETEITEMAQLKEEKGTRVIYTINCQTFQEQITSMNNDIETQNEEAAARGGEILPLIVYTDTLSQYLDMQLALLDKYAYDGFTIVYNGQATGMISSAEIAEMETIQEIIFDKVMPVINAHPDKTFMYEGLPQYLIIDRNLLTSFDYLVFRTYTASSIYDITRYVNDGLVFTDIPTDRVIVMAAPAFSDVDGTAYGSILDAGGKPASAIEMLAKWVATEDPQFTKAGMGVWRINKDYYVPGSSYQAVLEAIEIMNPSTN